MDEQVSISLSEIVDEISKINPMLAELAIERIKSRKLAEALSAANAEKAEVEDDSTAAEDN